MGFLIKAAALAMSVIASVFTGLDAPQVHAKHASKLVDTLPVSRSAESAPVVLPQRSDIRVITVSAPKPGQPLDAESRRFLELIRSMPKAKEPVSDHPWYMSDALDVFRALVSGETNDL